MTGVTGRVSPAKGQFTKKSGNSQKGGRTGGRARFILKQQPEFNPKKAIEHENTMWIGEHGICHSHYTA